MSRTFAPIVTTLLDSYLVIHPASQHIQLSCLGTLLTSCELIKQQGGNVLGCVVLFELTELNGAAQLPVKCFSLLQS